MKKGKMLKSKNNKLKGLKGWLSLVTVTLVLLLSPIFFICPRPDYEYNLRGGGVFL